jgi:signal transduction histidine kinase
VTDDGKGIPDDAVATAVARGHIGLRSQQLRLQAAGGQLTLDRAQPAGTVATVELPLSGVG